MGDGNQQLRDLETSVNAAPADVVVDGSPADLERALRLEKPVVDVRHELDDGTWARLAAALGRTGVL